MAQDLLPLGLAATPAKTTSEAISDSLAKILERATSADEAAQYIVADYSLLSECRVAYPEVERLASAAGRDGVYVALQPLILLFGRPDYGKGEIGEALRNEWTKIYADALHKLCREALEVAVTEWLQKGKPFFPKPCELYKLAERAHINANSRAWRMRKAIERGDAAHRVDRVIPSEEDRAKVRAMMAELRQKLGSKTGVLTSSHRLAATPHKAAENIRRTAG